MTHQLPSEMNFYEVLGVPRTASAEEIKTAYRKLALLHHPDRAHANKPPNTKETFDPNDDAFIQQVNVAYDTLSDPEARLKYDYELFGSSSSSTSGSTGGSNYVRMTAADVDQMFSGLNTFERFTTAQYHALRSAKAPASIGRRRTNFAERKAFRAAATPLPSKSASMGWLAFPLLVAGIWGYNLSSVKNNARR